MAKRKNTFIHKPVYPGGKTALQAFLRKEMKYPPAALESRTQGSVRVEYSLNQQGKVIKAVATKGPEHGCREEAVRLVKMLRFQVPKDYKMSVRYHQHLDINFKLPAKKAATAGKVTYTITPAKAPKTTPGKSGGSGSSGYDYTITW